MVASDFLSCSISHFPFNFLGLPIRINPYKRSSWDPVLMKLHRKLATWKGKSLSLGGRVTLLNFILSVVSLFYLSFYIAQKVIIQDIIKIQRAFLWCGEEHKKRINWVSLETICKSKQHGDLIV